MAKTSLTDKAVQAVVYINAGRIGLFTPGKEGAGRISWQGGINISQTVFQDAQTSGDPRIIILVEIAFLQQELNYSDEADNVTKSSLTKAIQSFRDAIACLKIVGNSIAYKAAATTYPNDAKNRIKTYPRDAVHQACSAHWTRLQNILRSPGINMQEKAVLQQRAANMKTAQTRYLEKQKKALE
jgi:hypothetical protein